MDVYIFSYIAARNFLHDFVDRLINNNRWGKTGKHLNRIHMPVIHFTLVLHFLPILIARKPKNPV